ncbi:Similar to SYT7: Synaptotagmin-7 (Homo sapiens), partial [Cotesia congregata]
MDSGDLGPTHFLHPRRCVSSPGRVEMTRTYHQKVTVLNTNKYKFKISFIKVNYCLQVDFSEKPSFWKALKPPAKDKCGELLCSLCYHPSNSILTLTLLKARNLKAKDINGKSDPYVKVWLQFGDKRIEKRKTPIFKCTLNPVFNEAFSFNVPWEKIRECSLDVMVMDFDNIGRNELIGRIQLAGI